MCGINGFNFKDRELVYKMNELNRHRGPDGQGVFIDDGISLGHNRLAIIDLSQNAAQPMHDEVKRYWLVYNGEIYNYQDLRKGLENKYNFFSDSDSEVILRLFQQHDVECFKMLNGIFAIAIWDSFEKRLILARDFVGVKPLYYFNQNNKLIFSSEIKSILVHPVERSVDLDSLLQYFKLLYVPEPKTMFKNINKFPAGHYAVFKNNKLKLESFKRVNFGVYAFTSKQEAAEKIRTVFHDSIKRQLVSDKPLGIFLSGGIDSSAVLAEASKIVQGSIKTFSVGFKTVEEEEKFNQDARLAKRTAEYFATDHCHFEISENDIKDIFDKMVWHMDEPNSNPTAAAIYLLSQRTKNKVDVVLGGDGGDELFGGYPRYYFGNLISRYQTLPKIIQSLGLMFLRLLGKSKAADKFKPNKTDAQKILSFLGQPDKSLRLFLNEQLFKPEADIEVFNQILGNCPNVDFATKFMYADLNSWLRDESLVRSDKMTMAHGLEQRVPILDNEMIDVAFSIPGAWKLKNSKRGKDIWIQAVKDLLPPYLLEQPKRGWFSPMAKWLRYGLKDLAKEHVSQLNDDYFNRTAALKMFDEHVEKKQYNLSLIWALVTWQAWYNKFFINK